MSGRVSAGRRETEAIEALGYGRLEQVFYPRARVHRADEPGWWRVTIYRSPSMREEIGDPRPSHAQALRDADRLTWFERTKTPAHATIRSRVRRGSRGEG